MTDDFTAIARRMVDRHKPQGVAGLDVFEYADLAAFLEWDVDATVPTMAEDFGIDEDSARELLLGARSERLGTDLEDEANEHVDNGGNAVGPGYGGAIEDPR